MGKRILIFIVIVLIVLTILWSILVVPSVRGYSDPWLTVTAQGPDWPTPTAPMPFHELTRTSEPIAPFPTSTPQAYPEVATSTPQSYPGADNVGGGERGGVLAGLWSFIWDLFTK